MERSIKWESKEAEEITYTSRVEFRFRQTPAGLELYASAWEDGKFKGNRQAVISLTDVACVEFTCKKQINGEITKQKTVISLLQTIPKTSDHKDSEE